MTTQNISRTSAAQADAYPKKLFYRIQEAAEITGLEAHVLRYWETQFRELAPEKDRSGHRRYRQEDIERIFHIRDLLHKRKFTIAGARQQLKNEKKERSAAKKAPKKARRKPRARSEKKDTLLGIRNELTDLMNRLSA
ncbi:MAG: MerR family transcriptional regulator [Candidatus Sumerlaeota bacterium]